MLKPYLFVENTAEKGRGVFTHERIPAHTVIEVSPVIVMEKADREHLDKTLLHDYITVEELRACTTCNACVEACPVSINPLDIIVELRRSLVMEESNAPQEWNAMFGNVENNFAPWKLSPDDRDRWARELF